MNKGLTIIVVIVVGGFFVLTSVQKIGNFVTSDLFQANLGALDISGNTVDDTPQTPDNNPVFDPKYSFSQDEDKDELPNAWEQIFGSDPYVTDSDGDGFQDGEEVRNGFDPMAPGDAKIKDSSRYKRNLTVQYFVWAKEQTGEPIPRFSTELVDEFVFSCLLIIILLCLYFLLYFARPFDSVLNS